MAVYNTATSYGTSIEIHTCKHTIINFKYAEDNVSPMHIRDLLVSHMSKFYFASFYFYF